MAEWVRKQFDCFAKYFIPILQELQPYGHELCELVHWFCKFVERIPKFRAFFGKSKEKFILVKTSIAGEKETVEAGGLVTLKRVRYSQKGKEE